MTYAFICRFNGFSVFNIENQLVESVIIEFNSSQKTYAQIISRLRRRLSEITGIVAADFFTSEKIELYFSQTAVKKDKQYNFKKKKYSGCDLTIKADISWLGLPDKIIARWNSLAQSLANAYYAQMPVMNLSPKVELLFLLPFIVKGGISCDVRDRVLSYNNDKNFMREALSLQPSLFKHASAVIRDDFKIALMVLKQNGGQYKFISEQLKSRRILAYHGAKGAIKFTELAPRFRSDAKIAAAFVANHGEVYESLPGDMRNEEKVFLAAMNNYSYAYSTSGAQYSEHGSLIGFTSNIPAKFLTKKYALQVLEIFVSKNPAIVKKYNTYEYFIPDEFGGCFYGGHYPCYSSEPVPISDFERPYRVRLFENILSVLVNDKIEFEQAALKLICCFRWGKGVFSQFIKREIKYFS